MNKYNTCGQIYGRFFGQYLWDKGLINRQQLESTLEKQLEQNQPLGVLALDMGWLTSEQIKLILNKQKTSDLRFGEQAIQMGILSMEQVQSLLHTQAQSHLYLGQILVENKILSYEQLEQMLTSFHRECDDSAHKLKQKLNTLPHKDLALQLLLTWQRLCSRILCSPVKISVLDQTSNYRFADIHSFLKLQISISGHQDFSCGLSLNRRSVYSLAYCLLGKETANQEVIMQTLDEFCSMLSHAARSTWMRSGTTEVIIKNKIQNSWPQKNFSGIVLQSGVGEFPLLWN